MGSGSLTCNDGNVCTSDSCNPASGCAYATIYPCCGNNVTEGGEECDDGNQTNGDGCSSTCQDEGIGFPPPVGYEETSNGGTWRVCRADSSTAWISGKGSGVWNSVAICTSLGYSGVNAFGGTCGTVCGYCGSGAETYDNNGTSCGWPPNLCYTVHWRCYK